MYEYLLVPLKCVHSVFLTDKIKSGYLSINLGTNWWTLQNSAVLFTKALKPAHF